MGGGLLVTRILAVGKSLLSSVIFFTDRMGKCVIMQGVMLQLHSSTRFFVLLLLLLIGCKTDDEVVVVPTITPHLVMATAPAGISAPTPLPPTATAQYSLALSPQDIFTYPYPSIHAGEKLSLRVQPSLPDGVQPEDVLVEVQVDGEWVAAQSLGSHPLSNEAGTVLEWIWDSDGQAGEHQIEVALLPQNGLYANEARTMFALTVQPPVATGTWQIEENDCCRVHVLSGSAAAKDLGELSVAVETAVSIASRQLGEAPNHVLDFYFIERMIGQGGYAGTAVVVSYGERDYANVELEQILVHEAIHIIDRQFAPNRIPFLAEGVAVWGSDGHYKPENLDERAAALRQIGQYVPLTAMVDNFYMATAHEIGYLEAASFINYLIDTYGWQRFRAFYADTTQNEGQTAVSALSTSLQTHYEMGLAEAEAEWLAYLDGIDVGQTAVTDLQTTLYFYNSMRRYQELFDPPAHFLQAWLPAPNAVLESGNPADLARHPQEELNVVLELMLESASHALLIGDYERADNVLDSVNRVLSSGGQFIDPLAINYRDVIRQLGRREYEPSRIIINGDRAEVTAVSNNSRIPRLVILRLQGNDWVFVN